MRNSVSMSEQERDGEKHAERVALAVLGKIKEIDRDAIVQSVTPSEVFAKNGGVVVRITPGNASGPKICQQVRAAWPLTTAVCVECSLSGDTVVQVFVPEQKEMKENAFGVAKEMSRVVRILGSLIRLCAISLVVVLLSSVLSHGR